MGTGILQFNGQEVLPDSSFSREIVSAIRQYGYEAAAALAAGQDDRQAGRDSLQDLRFAAGSGVYVDLDRVDEPRMLLHPIPNQSLTGCEITRGDTSLLRDHAIGGPEGLLTRMKRGDYMRH